MPIKFEWTTINPHLVLAEDEKNVLLTSIHWVRTATLDEMTVNSYGMARLPDGGKLMTPEEHEKLTDKQVLAILNKLVSVKSIDAELTAKMKQSNTPNTNQ